MNTDAIRRKARLGRALRKGFRGAYDHLGYVVFVSLTAFIITAGVFAVSAQAMRLAAGAPGVVGLLVYIPPAFAAFMCAVGVYYYAKLSVYGDHPAPAETLTGIKTLLGPAVKLFAVDMAITIVLVGDFVFFAGIYLATRNLLMMAPAVLFLYMSLFWLITALYHLPLLPAQLEAESGTGPFVIIRKSILLAVDNLGFTVGLFVVILGFAIICAVPAFVGMAVLFLGALAFILTHALRELYIKYEIVQDEPDAAAEDTPWKLPGSE